VVNTLNFFWDNEFFDKVFPVIKQQKPGEDYYVWLCFLGVSTFIYSFFLYPNMTALNSASSLSEQINST